MLLFHLSQSDALLSCACACVGAPLATAGATARVDSDGQAACEECGRRLTRCKGKLYKHGAGKICQRCYNIAEGRQKVPCAPVSAAPVHSPTSSTGQPSSDTLAQPPQATPPLLHGSSRLRRNVGAVLDASTRSSRACVKGWLELAEDDEVQSHWRPLPCGCDELDTARSLICSFLDEKRVRLRHSAARVAREVLSSRGFVASEAALLLGTVRLLRIPKGVSSPPPSATKSTTVVLRLNPDEPERFLLLVQFRHSRERF